MSGRLGRHAIGRYGVGTLWCVREVDAFVIQFNAKKIARRPLNGGAWTTLEAGWKVTPYDSGELHVQLHTARASLFRLPGTLANDCVGIQKPSPRTSDANPCK
jgi:hypothetical protein